MYKLEGLTIKFDEKCVYSDTSFKCDRGSITAIVGASGSGKTTLLNVLGLRLKAKFNIIYDQQKLEYYNNHELDDFRKETIYYVEQEPKFYNEITIQNHLDMYDVNSSNEKITALINQLSLNDILHLYPNQLSGGEKMRVSFLFAYITNADILLLDEPIASLDKNNIEIVINLIQKYADEGHHVVVSTHNEDIERIAHKVYQIKDKKLHCIKEHIKIEDTLKQNKKVEIKHLWRSFIYAKKYKMSRNIIYYLVLGIVISFSTISLFSNTYALQYQEDILDDMSSSILIIFKDSNMFSEVPQYNVDNPYFTENEVNKLKDIPHVENLVFSYQSSIVQRDDLDGKFIDTTQFSIYKDNKLILNKNIGMSKKDSYIEDGDSSGIYVYSSETEVTLESYILGEEDFEKDGVYLSKELADNIGYKFEEGTTLKTKVYILTHYVEGMVEKRNSIGELLPCFTPIGKQVEIEVPILGILNGYPQNHQYGKQTNQPIYLSNTYIETLRESIDVKDNFVITFEDYEKFPLITEGETFTFSSWVPNKYFLKVDSLSNVNGVIEKLDEMHINYYSEYADYKTVEEIVAERKASMIFASLGLGIGVCIASVLIIKSKSKNESDMMTYFENYGYGKRGIFIIKMKYYFMDTCIASSCALITMLIIIPIFAKTQISYVEFDMYMIPIMILLTCIVTFVLPIVINRKNYD